MATTRRVMLIVGLFTSLLATAGPAAASMEGDLERE